jgi:mRNA interferase MazF
LADAGRGDWILSQITSNPYGDPLALPLDASDFTTGGLHVGSFVRPGKLFTAHTALMIRSVGTLEAASITRILSAVVAILQPPSAP